MSIKVMILSLSIVFCSISLSSQDFTGLWEVKKVQVGDEQMTPVAKWIRINADHSYDSGNGWLQNSEGNWSFDPKDMSYLPREKNGIKDEYGPFKLTLDSEEMVWKREEDGHEVIVVLSRIDKISRSHMDKVVGLWKLSDNSVELMAKEEENAVDEILWIKWTRNYQLSNAEDAKTERGYWIMNAHYPELILIQRSLAHQEKWMLEFSDDEKMVKFIGRSDSNKGIVKNYSRLYEYP